MLRDAGSPVLWLVVPGDESLVEVLIDGVGGLDDQKMKTACE